MSGMKNLGKVDKKTTASQLYFYLSSFLGLSKKNTLSFIDDTQSPHQNLDNSTE